MTPGLQNFIDILTGDLDNQAQIDSERAAGQQIHPYAKHVTRVITDRISGLPPDFDGIFILEESYYRYPGQDELQIKPLLFRVEPEGEHDVRLSSIIIPDRLAPEEVVNANRELQFTYVELQANPWFGRAHYRWQPEGCFKVHHPCELGDGKRFSLIETLSKEELRVMELLEQNGKRLTPYATPILYRPIKN